MQDFMELGMLGLGNDSLTTAQYGGTGHAGDVGTAAKDEYGLNTSIGTGKRMAEVLKIDRYRASAKLTNKPKIGIIIFFAAQMASQGEDLGLQAILDPLC